MQLDVRENIGSRLGKNPSRGAASTRRAPGGCSNLKQRPLLSAGGAVMRSRKTAHCAAGIGRLSGIVAEIKGSSSAATFSWSRPGVRCHRNSASCCPRFQLGRSKIRASHKTASYYPRCCCGQREPPWSRRIAYCCCWSLHDPRRTRASRTFATVCRPPGFVRSNCPVGRTVALSACWHRFCRRKLHANQRSVPNCGR